MKKNENARANKFKIFMPFVGVLIFMVFAALAHVNVLSAQTLSEGLWKEFVDGDPAAAKAVYENIIRGAANAESTGEAVLKKAESRLKALGEGKSVKSGEPANPHKFSILKANLKFLFSHVIKSSNNKEFTDDLNSLKENIKSELSNFIKEDLEKHSLPIVFIISRNSELNLKNTDIILSFDKDVTFKNDENSAANNIYGYNINWNTLFITSMKTEKEVIDEYKKIGLWQADKNNSGGNADRLDSILLYCYDNAQADFSFITNDMEQFISVNKILPAKLEKAPRIKDVNIFLDDKKRILLAADAEIEQVNYLLGALESATGLKILPAGVIRNRDGSAGYQVKLSTISELSELLSAALPAINNNFSGARRLASYKSCMANLRNITSVTELYLMENEKFKRENIDEKFIGELYVKKYLKAEPVCAAGGKYIVKNSDFICSLHGSNSKTIEFKIVKITDGKEKTISAPKIKTLIYREAAVTIDSRNNSGDTAENSIKNASRNKPAEELKFLKLVVKLSKDGETAETNDIIAGVSVSVILSAGENKERSMQFNAKYKLGSGGNAWNEISGPRSDELKDYKIYMKIN